MNDIIVLILIPFYQVIIILFCPHFMPYVPFISQYNGTFFKLTILLSIFECVYFKVIFLRISLIFIVVTGLFEFICFI